MMNTVSAKKRLFTNGLIKNLWYDCYNLLLFLGTFVLLMLSFFAISYLNNNMAGATNSGPRFSTYTPSITTIFPAYFGLLLFATKYTNNFKCSMAYNSTRKEFFLASQVTKLLTVIALFVTSQACILLWHFVETNVLSLPTSIAIPTWKNILPFIFITILASSLGELLGIVILRLGKWGMLIYIAFITIVSGIMGGLVGAGVFLSKNIFAFLNSPMLFVVLLGLAVTISIFDWFLFRHLEVKV